MIFNKKICVLWRRKCRKKGILLYPSYNFNVKIFQIFCQRSMTKRTGILCTKCGTFQVYMGADGYADGKGQISEKK